ncbi:hypothetical protein UPYG_G00119850 [Umbra pygmaea]|uniref:HMG box domain-containing protein n=1 Tax=Umbra pygmaea TaxID=75934 RepID=A0ABD0XS77_UMBPY
MYSRSEGRGSVRRKSKNQKYWSTCWSNSLKEMAGLLPISVPRNGRGLTKKETLAHMLRYFDFLQSKIQSLQSRLPPHCIPKQEPDTGSESDENTPSEPCSPCHIMKVKRKYVCSRSRKKAPASNSELKPEFKVKRKTLRQAVANKTKADPEADPDPVPMWGVHSDWSAHHSSDSHGAWHGCDSDSQLSSLESGFSLNHWLHLSTSLQVCFSPGCSGTVSSVGSGTSTAQGGYCSACEELIGSDCSPDFGELHTPTTPITGPGSLFLKDHMHGVGERWKTFLSPAATPQQHTLLPFGTREGLNLSPSLLTSPARGLGQWLLPEGPGELHVLFEDVWVSPKPTHAKVSRLPFHDPTESLSEREVALRQGSGGWLSSQSEDEEGDATWTPLQQQAPLKSRTSSTPRRRRARSTTGDHPCLKKKCINGFIMFCRVNRKTYLRSHPGTASTEVTKELANLWHAMPKQERRVYCLMARRFSRQQNRNVRSALVEGEDEDCVPSPLHTLLAQRDLCAAGRGPS